VALNRFYAKDNYEVFHSDEKIFKAEPSTFEVLDEFSGLSKDIISKYSFLKNDGYSSWARDKNHVYYCGEILLKGTIDPSSVSIVDTHVLKDRKHVYYFDKIVEGADPESFQPILKHDKAIKDKLDLFTSFYRDKHNLYYLLEHTNDEDENKIVSISQLNTKQGKITLKNLLAQRKEFGLMESEISMIRNLIK